MNSTTIEEIVKWRMGAAYDAPIFDWRDQRLNFDSPAALEADYAGGVSIEGSRCGVYTPSGRTGYEPANQKRLRDVSQDLLKAMAGVEHPLHVFLAMQDARLFASVEYNGPRAAARCTQLSYARTVLPHWRNSTEIVLWPLTESFRWWKLPSFTPPPWDLRKPLLLWRGQPTGMSYHLSEDAKPNLPGIRKYRRWLNGWLKYEAADNQGCFNTFSSTFQRLAAVALCQQIEDTDVKLVPMWDGDRASIVVAQKYLGEDAASERIGLDDYLFERGRHKYVLSLPGNDVPSSLRHDLLSGSLVLMPKPFWESVWFFGLKPNVHYIELRADMADLEERLQWCRDNDALCRDTAESGRAFALEHFEPSLEFEVQSRLAARLARQTLPPDAA